MADWLITCAYKDANEWSVRLADCDEEHALSVMQSLHDDPANPNDLRLENLTPEPEPEPEPEPVFYAPIPAFVPEPKKRRFFRRK